MGFDTDSGNGRVNPNRAVIAVRNFVVADTIAPTVTFAAAANLIMLAGSVNVVVNTSDNIGVSCVELFIDDTLAAQSLSAATTFAWDTLTETDGAHTLEARAYDTAGNVGTSTVIRVWK